MGEIIYRLATPADAARMAEIRMDMQCESRPGLHSAELIALVRKNNEDYFAQHLADDMVISWLAFDGDTLIGTGSVNFSQNPPNFHCPTGMTAYIANIYTIPEKRGSGVATEIFHRCVASAQERGCERITLSASDAGRPIYEKYGFKTSANAMAYYPAEHTAK